MRGEFTFSLRSFTFLAFAAARRASFCASLLSLVLHARIGLIGSEKKEETPEIDSLPQIVKGRGIDDALIVTPSGTSNSKVMTFRNLRRELENKKRKGTECSLFRT
jgi:hypothetical protein